MTETEFDEAFQDLIARPWPSAKGGERSVDFGVTQDVDFVAAKNLAGSDRVAPKSGAVTGASNMPEGHIYPILAAPRVFPDFGARRTDRFAKSANLLLPHPTSHGTHGTRPRGGSRGGRSQNFRDRLGTCATVAREGSLVPWCIDIDTPDDPAALGFSCVDINTTEPTPWCVDMNTPDEPAGLAWQSQHPKLLSQKQKFWCHDIMTRDDPVAMGFSRTDIGTRAD